MAREINFAELKVEGGGILERLVLGAQKALGLCSIFRLQASPLICLGVMGVIGLPPFDQPISVLHLMSLEEPTYTFHPCAQSAGTAPVRIQADFLPKCPVHCPLRRIFDLWSWEIPRFPRKNEMAPKVGLEPLDRAGAGVP